MFTKSIFLVPVDGIETDLFSYLLLYCIWVYDFDKLKR